MKRATCILLTIVLVFITFTASVFAADTNNTPSLTTDKTEYKYGEDITVTASGGTDTAWVGIYNKGDVPGTGIASLYWYYSNENWSKGKAIVIQEQKKENGAKVLPAGKYEIHLFKDSKYEVIKTIEITVTGGPGIGEPDDEDLTNSKLISIFYDLDNDTDGLANGIVTIKADSSTVAGADCIMYWADRNGEPLEGYTPLAKFRLKGEVTEHDMYDYTIIPEGAKTLIAYLSRKGSLIGDPVSTVLPEGCNYIIEDDHNVEFQLISDIHINQGNHAYNTHFTQMLDDVRNNSPESIGIFVNGDIADHGRESEYERLLSLYDAVKDKGRIPEIHMAIGNHDWSEGNPNGRFQKYVNKLNPEVETETVYYDETVAGHHFIFLGSEEGGTWATLKAEQLTWFDNRMQEITKEDPEKPVFVLLHQPLKNTVAGSLPGQGWHGVNDEQKLRDILKKYDQIIIAGGHSHWELDSEMNMYPGDDNMSIAVNTASVGYLWTSYNTAQGENADGSHGYYVRVYDDKVLFLGRDIENSRFVSSGMFVVEKNHINTSKEEYTIDLENSMVDMKAAAVGGGELTFASSDPEVVSVAEDGMLSANRVGTATITISAPATDRYVKNSEQVQVTVVENIQEDEPEPEIPPIDPPEEEPDEPAHEHDWKLIYNGQKTHTKECVCGESETDNCIWGEGTITKQPSADEDGIVAYVCSVCDGVYEEPLVYENNESKVIERIYGSDRYKTAYKAADTLKEQLRVEKFNNIIIANGTNFADALAGSYLAEEKDAPILLTDNKKANVQELQQYVNANIKRGGTVYLLGGDKAVTDSVAEGLENCTVERLAGADRYATNLAILKEAGAKSDEILVCTGDNFADSLSASASERPILLVGNKGFTEAQISYLAEAKSETIHVIGGEQAVSNSVFKEAKEYASEVKRLEGATRYETSVKVAEEFFKDPNKAVIVYGQNFPDGLSGGPLAVSLGGPLILSKAGSEAAAAVYAEKAGITSGMVLGGPTLVSDSVVKKIFRMADDTHIVVR